MTLYAVGDIHGQAAELDRALALIEADGGPDAQVVFLGDFTDRGPDSRGVLDRLIEGRDAGRNWRFVRGNHDQMFLNFLTNGAQHDSHIGSGLSWMNKRLGGPSTLASYGLGGAPLFLHDRNGGRETLASYEIDGQSLSDMELSSAAREAVPDAHVQFLSDLPHHIEEGDLLFVHAGIAPDVPLAQQDPEDLMWIRDGWLEVESPHPWLVIHGHTALDFPEHRGNRVNLDGGAGYGRPLIPAAIEGRSVFTLHEDGRRALVPGT
ncbi:diadenosine tetraphosphatase [Rhodobacteraceae bacterium THAF1]|uniref:metallophosphoesterase family protein n=1 Tax=Palleronia sp. THAF1 TaxID=2587842 RepID=UPI000F3C5956|nr:metallophosphoesterase family protein [Palleronia sp. THAF1]QFU09955.1 diadenosine tetraphosphatase [Palleronia sp. THAF1]VDC17140.1 diadenosine tetraphosphatase [Rhodobacteraceae bacterium THAF1]